MIDQGGDRTGKGSGPAGTGTRGTDPGSRGTSVGDVSRETRQLDCVLDDTGDPKGRDETPTITVRAETRQKLRKDRKRGLA